LRSLIQVVDKKAQLFCLEVREPESEGLLWFAITQDPNYIQHSPHIAPGREGLFGLIKGLPSTVWR
jgi:hypothetical protein